MHYDFKSHKYWLAAGAVFLLLIVWLYPYTTYDDLKMEITRTEAIEISTKFLAKQRVDIDRFLTEGFLERNMGANQYLQRNLDVKKYTEIIERDEWLTYGWHVMFHKNLSRNEPQTRYNFTVSHKGKIHSFRKEIPDTAFAPSLSREDATNLIINFIRKFTSINLDDFELTESKENNLSKRTDYNFRWEKECSEITGKLVVTASVLGNQPGSFSYRFEAPDGNEMGIDTIEALFSTFSAIFIFFLTQYAIFIFLRKYHQGEVWVKMGRNLFIIYFLFAITNLINSYPGIGRSTSIGDLNFLTVKIIVMLINGLLVQFFIGLFVFASWSVGESYARSLWPNKLKGMDAFVKGHITSLHTGASLMMGLVIGTGIFVIHLLLSYLLNSGNGDAFVNIISYLSPYNTFLPALDIFTDAFTTSMLFSVAIIFFVVNLSYQRWKRKWLSIFMAGFISMLGTVIIYSSVSINVFTYDLLIIFATGCLIAYLYFAFDLLTIFSINFTIYLLKTGFVLLAGGTTFSEINFLILLLVYLTTPVIYIISRMRKEEFVLENYGAPSHIQRISERERLKKELEIAAKVQLSLLPKEQLKLIGYDIAAISIPAIEAGGDYYDFVNLGENKVGIAIGDVSGKGVGAAIYMTLTKGILQAHAEENVSPRVVLGKVNRLLYKTIEKNSFVSMFYAILDTEKHEIVYSRAGHNPGILCSLDDGSTRLLMGKGMALGLEEGVIFTDTLFEDNFKLNIGDVVVLYTDGFTEAMNEKLEQYGEDKLTELIQNNRDKKSSDLLDIIFKDARRHMDNYPQHDDMTIVIIKRI
ncbi:PP2C family protein-serine/threonine phosphatase [Bacteroidota bacterium]